jgi:DNA-binding FadR family transcriptional regulator
VCGTQEWDLLNPIVLAASIRHDAELAILEDLVDVRQALEGQMAAEAAERADRKQLDRIETAFNQLFAEEQDPARFLRADLDFHDAIMAASGNRLARAVIHTINTEAFRSLRYIGETTHQDCVDSNVEHRHIYEALTAKDGPATADAMRGHILRSWRHRRPMRPEDKR